MNVLSICVIAPSVIKDKVYKPKVAYHAVPKHLKPPISEKELAGSQKRVKRIPEGVSIEGVYDRLHVSQFFKNTRESMKEAKALYDEARSASTGVKKLTSLIDNRQFLVPCIISRVDFLDALCDTWFSVSIMSNDITEKLSLVT